MLETLLVKLRTWTAGRILLVTLLLSVGASTLVVSGMSVLFHGRIQPDYLVTGFVTSLLVSFAVTFILTRLIRLLRDAEAMAQQSSEIKSAFLANMSHEIRTPISAIVGMSDLCLSTALDERQRHYIDNIKLASEALLHVINDVLDFSKIDADKLEMESEPFVLDAVFDRLSSVTALQAEKKGIELIYDVVDDGHTLIGDMARLVQILVNLVGNALKFSRSGNVVVKVEPVATKAESIELHFSVRDEGIGMSPDQVRSIFKPFIQADVSTTRRYGGTGLGLTICRRLVGMMDGRIWVESKPGNGSTFHFTARFGVTAKVLSSAQSGRSGRFAPYAGSKVLVVASCPLVRGVLARRISEFGFAVRAVDSVASVLELRSRGQEHDYLACFVEQTLLAVDTNAIGKLAAAFFNRKRSEATRLILITPYSDREERSDSDLGVHGRIEKPVITRRLATEFMRCLNPEQAELARDSSNVGVELDWARFRGLDVLLIDDVELNREVVTELLAAVGLKVRTACDGEEGLAAIAREKPDVVLMDCLMPVMDGYTAARKIRENLAWADLPIIALSANAMTTDLNASLLAGMNAHLAKPMNMAALHDCLVQCLPEWNAWPIAGSAAASPVGIADLPMFPGIEMNAGLIHVDGNLMLLYRVMKMFRDDQGRHFHQRFADVHAAADWRSAAQLAHALKGSARMMGAIDLGEAAANLEVAARQGDAALCEELLPQVLEHLRCVASGLVDVERYIAEGA